MDKNCIFCKIASKQIPSEIFWEDDDFFTIFDIYPKVKNHLLLIPKLHFRILEDAPSHLLEKMMPTTQKVVKLLQIKYDFTDFNLALNNGVLAGQEIPHLHLHILPSANSYSK